MTTNDNDGGLNSSEVPTRAIKQRLMTINGNLRHRTVMPEVAGSSPVAPVRRPKSARYAGMTTSVGFISRFEPK